jgi:glycosyltransferase involved in cell wall biosynthesis
MPEMPILSIVIPALNEELTIGEFVDWCKQGLKEANISGQILIVDSSTDRTADIAEQHGAEVLRVPKRGLGRAYIDAIPFIKGKYVIMGDCDLTYDFRKLSVFLEKFEQGYEYVMGSRYKGFIEQNAMPKLHQYFGTPITTFILNQIYGTQYSDIHCGMRGITLEALKKMDLQSQSWEYASEMVLKASKMRLAITEVPVYFYKDREGRLSHHKRAGWFSAWSAGWINLKAMFIYAPDFFLLKPGIFFFVIGLLLALSLSGGAYTIGPVELNLHWMLFGITLSTMGYSAFHMASIARLYYRYDIKFNNMISKIFSYNRGILYSIILFITGFILNLVLLLNWLGSGLKLSNYYYPGILGLLLMILGFQTFTFTLLVEMLRKK